MVSVHCVSSAQNWLIVVPRDIVEFRNSGVEKLAYYTGCAHYTFSTNHSLFPVLLILSYFNAQQIKVMKYRISALSGKSENHESRNDQ